MVKYFIIGFLLLACIRLEAQSRKSVRYSTDALVLINPAAGFLGSIARDDFEGAKQIFIGSVSGFAASYILKYTVRKERPDGSNHRSFPSAHTCVAFQGATFLHKRFGAKVSIPAYAIATYVAWGRIYAKKHDIWDVLGGAILGATSSVIFTKSYPEKFSFTLYPSVIDNRYPGFYASFTF